MYLWTWFHAWRVRVQMHVHIWHGIYCWSSEVNIIVIVVLSDISLAIGDSTMAIRTGCGLHRLCLAVLTVYILMLIVPVSDDTLD